MTSQGVEFAPELATARDSALRVPAVLNSASAIHNQAPSLAYESGSYARRLNGWRSPTISPNAILGLLSTIRDRSRQATRNDGYAKAISDKLVTNLIGTGIKPLSQAQDPDLRKAIQARWLRWTDESDADGLLDFYGQQAQAARSWLDGGEVFARLRLRLPSDGLSVPIQVQIVEPELCPYTYTVIGPNGNRIRAGVEFDAIGRRVAYWFHPSRPELDDFDRARLVRVPAELVIHLFDPLRPGQIRGIPNLAQALIRLHELDKFDDATLLRQQLANLFAGFITRNANYGDTEALNPLTGLPPESGTPPTLSLEPGIFQELEPGEDVKFSDPPKVPDTYAAFMRQQLRAACIASGVPYEIVTGDMGGMNDRTVRVVLNDFKRRITMMQHQFIGFQLCRRVWQAWMDRAWLTGALPIPAAYGKNPEPFAAVKWVPPRWAYLHPVQDVDADKQAIRAGFTTRADVVSEYGEDAESIDEQQAADNARADELGLRYDSDGRQPAAGPRETFTDPGTPNQNDPAAQPAGAAA